VIDVKAVDRQLKTMQDGIEAESTLYRRIRLFLKIGQHGRLIQVMESVYDLIGQTHKPVDIIDGLTQVFVQHPDR
jgi:hypothetical protein